MAAKKKESIQFEDADAGELQKDLSGKPGKIKAAKEDVVRRSFRVPCEKEDAAFVEIAGKKYPVVNMSNKGLGILLPDEAIFSRGEKLPEIAFSFRSQKMILQGCVVHVSVEDEKTFLCGISLRKMSEEQEKMLLAFVQRQRLAMFGRE